MKINVSNYIVSTCKSGVNIILFLIRIQMKYIHIDNILTKLNHPLITYMTQD